MHSIMEHHAHHLNPRISMFGLRAAEARLSEQYPELPAYRLDGPTYRDVVRRCKLYDFNEHAWLDFAGRVTARVPLAGAPPATQGT
jgi:omega-6 fatty acid desaturase (delta-12 desaturase)